jgi:hypothetical protein
MVVILPLALGGFAASIRGWLVAHARRMAGATRSKAARRPGGQAQPGI